MGDHDPPGSRVVAMAVAPVSLGLSFLSVVGRRAAHVARAFRLSSEAKLAQLLQGKVLQFQKVQQPADQLQDPGQTLTQSRGDLRAELFQQSVALWEPAG